MWRLVVDEVLGELHNCGYYIVGYAHDIAILMNGKFPFTVSDLELLQRWCDKTTLSI
jgi:hypothetical protein